MNNWNKYFKKIVFYIDSPTVDKAAMRNDAAAELDRITKTKKNSSVDTDTSTES